MIYKVDFDKPNIWNYLRYELVNMMPNNEYLNDIFKLLPVPGIVLKKDSEEFKIVEANNAFLQLVSHTSDELVDKGFSEVFTHELLFTSAEWKNLISNVFFNKLAETTRAFQFKNKLTGEQAYYIVSLVPVPIENGEIALIIISFIKSPDSQPDNRFKALIQTVEGIVWEVDAETYKVTFVSDQVKSILGFSPEEWMSEPNFWQNHLHLEDKDYVISYCQVQLKEGKSHTLDYRMLHASGRVVWIKNVLSIIYENNRPKWLRGLMVDITETRRLGDFELLERKILELNSRKEFSLTKVLDAYVQGIESIFPRMHCSILQIKDGRMRNWSSPSLPKAYIDVVENLMIGDYVGSCGSAAFLGKRVIVSDIANDPKWKDYSELAISNNLRACWSEPIIDSEGKVIATFGIYYEEVKLPDEDELKIIDRSAAILKIILENRLNYELIRENTLLMTQGQELAHFGNWQWNIEENIVTWSDTLFGIYGLDKNSFEATFEGYQELLHTDDKERVKNIILNALQTKEDVEFEERIIRPSGELRHLKSWGKVIINEQGLPIKIIGACLDITESKIIQEKLLVSTNLLRSLVDAQTNYVIRTDLEGNYNYYNNKYNEDFGWFYAHADFLGINCMATVQPTDHIRVSEIAERCIANPNTVYSVELDNVKENGGVRSILWHFICLTDSASEPSEMQCIGIDVSELKQAENDLRISNERYEYVNKATQDAIYDWDIVNDHVIWGEGFMRLFGMEKHTDSYTVRKWFDRIHPADRDKLYQSLLSTLNNAEETNWVVEYQFRKMDGTYANVDENGYVIRNEEGIAVRMIGVLRDSTRQKEEQQMLKLMESAVTNTSDSVVIAESHPYDVTKLKIIYVNDAFIKLTGYSLNEIIGKSPLILNGLNPDIDDFNRMRTAFRNRESLEFETIQYKKSGEYFWVGLSMNPITDETGQLTHWICIGHDVTDRLEYVKAIEKQNKKFQEIAWMQSHVVRAPLARLMGLVDLIKNYQNTDMERNELLDHLLIAAKDFDRIIRNISEKSSQIY